MLKEVYINLLDQKEPKLNFDNNRIVNSNINNKNSKKNDILREIVNINEDELQLHKKYLRSMLPKNNFN